MSNAQGRRPCAPPFVDPPGYAIANAPTLNPNSSLIKGVVCGVRVEEVSDPLMQRISYLEKLIDEFAKGKATEKILRR